MVLLDLLGRRWTLRVLWELRDGPQSFRALQERCGSLSPTVLSARLHDLRDAQIVELAEAGYRLTMLGAQLFQALTPLQSWAERWAKATA